MKQLFLNIISFLSIVIFFMSGCVEHIGHDDTNKWRTDEITVVIDPSIKTLGPYEEVGALIENAFLVWGDYADTPSVNFIYASCTGKNNNCIAADLLADGVGGTYENSYIDGKILNASITINNKYEYRLSPEGNGLDLFRILVHETGHFWGIKHHSDCANDAMFENANQMDSGKYFVLSNNDIAAIRELYNQ